MSWDHYKNLMNEAINKFIFDERIISVLKRAREEQRTVFIAGNGGSAAISLHLACDLNKCSYKDWKNESNRFRAISLNGETSYITAIANDDGYENIFMEQLKNLAKPGDVLIVISSSGNSPNVVKAVEYANNNGLTSIGLTGFKGGRLKDICQYVGYVSVDDYGVCEDVHIIFTHYISYLFRNESDK